MKKNVIYFLQFLGVLLLFSSCNQPKAEFNINIKDVSKPMLVQIVDASTNVVIAQHYLKDGKTFSVKNPPVGYVYIQLNSPNNSYKNVMFLEAGKYEVSPNNIYVVEKSTSAKATEFIDYYKEKFALEKTISDSIALAEENFNRSPKNYAENVALSTRLSKQLEDAEPTAIENFARKHPNSEAVPFILNEAGKVETMTMAYKKIMGLTTPAVRNSKIGAKIMEEIAASSQRMVGRIARDIAGWDMEGVTYNNKVLNKLNLMICWSSRDKEMNNIHRSLIPLYEQYKNKGVEFIGISFDVDRNILAAITGDQGLKWPQYTDLRGSSSTNLSFSGNIMPYLFLVDKDKKILERDIDILNLQPMLDKHLKNL